MKLGEVGQVWCWAGRDTCMLIRYVKFDWAQCHEIWDVLALEGYEAGTLVKALLHNDVATGDGAKWERFA